ncbi:MAG: helix-turn-helix transcriptional regulator [Dorea sp.]|nr:helix-turn-helix transcriptional regulator [Dorea sp.]
MEHRKKNLAKIVGANIRKFRMEMGETQQELGEILGYGSTTIANYESGYRLPDLETLVDIAGHYQQSLDDFLKN